MLERSFHLPPSPMKLLLNPTTSSLIIMVSNRGATSVSQQVSHSRCYQVRSQLFHRIMIHAPLQMCCSPHHRLCPSKTKWNSCRANLPACLSRQMVPSRRLNSIPSPHISNSMEVGGTTQLISTLLLGRALSVAIRPLNMLSLQARVSSSSCPSCRRLSPKRARTNPGCRNYRTRRPLSCGIHGSR